MATNDFKLLAGSGGANVVTQAAYAALTTLLANGFSSGITSSAQINKVLRQATTSAALLGDFVIQELNQNVVDAGTTTTFLGQFSDAIRHLIASNGAYVVDTSVSANAITVTLSPAPTSYNAGMFVYVKVANDGTGAAATINVNALGNKSIKNATGQPPSPKQLRAGKLTLLVYDGADFEILSPAAPISNTPLWLTNTSSSTVPAWATWAEIRVTGGGGQGGGGDNVYSGGGGGSGGTVIATISVTAGAAYSWITGTGGTGGTAGSAGGNGGASSLTISGTTYTANGGSGGGHSASPAGGAGGTAVNGDLNITGGNGGDGAASGFTYGGNGAASYYGGGGRATTATSVDGNGKAPGSGGGGGYGAGSVTGGNGAAGLIYIKFYP